MTVRGRKTSTFKKRTKHKIQLNLMQRLGVVFFLWSGAVAKKMKQEQKETCPKRSDKNQFKCPKQNNRGGVLEDVFGLEKVLEDTF